MSEDHVLCDADWLLQTKLAQFGAIARHILSSSNLSEADRKALELIVDKCQSHNLTHIICEDEFVCAGLAEKLTEWERRGFHSAPKYISDRHRDLALGLILQDPQEPQAEE